jgi:glycosyltransferase involved in cell wall biosynthesis
MKFQMTKIVISHPTGNANVRAVLAGLYRAQMLEEFETCFASDPDAALWKLLPRKIGDEFLRRSFSIPKKHIHQIAFRELSRIGLSKIGLNQLMRREGSMFSVDGVYRNFDQQVSKRLKYLSKKHALDAVYAYEDGALQTFDRAKELGLKSFYDLPIGYWRTSRRLLAFELERWPDWAETIRAFKDSDEKLERKDKELIAADHIFVASQFTKSTLSEFPGNLPEISVIPYGFPPPAADKQYHSLTGRPLKLLFVGGLSQRKGIADLFAAVERIGHKVELTVVGRKPTELCIPLNDALKKHRYIPSLPHDQILKEMKASDVFVFPSLFEGFGLVVTEAMSQGTPAITTERTCGPDLITHNQDGWIVEAGNTEALQNQIENLLLNPQLVENAGREALLTAAQRPWSVYGDEVARTLLKLKMGFDNEQ